MLKAALLCSVVCTAFVVGDRTSVASQDKPAQVAKPVTLHEALKPFVGKKCSLLPGGNSWTLSFKSDNLKTALPQTIRKLDLVGRDFVRLTTPKTNCYIPMSSISVVWTH